MECNDCVVCPEWTWGKIFSALPPIVLGRFDHLMPKSVTVMCMLPACGQLWDIEQAKEIHVCISQVRSFDV